VLEPSVVQRPLVDPELLPRGPGTVTIDNWIKPDEWQAAGSYPFGGSGLPVMMSYVFDDHNLYVRVDFSREALGDEDTGFDLYVGGDNTTGDPLSTLNEPLGFGATTLLSWRGTAPVDATLHPRDPARERSAAGAPIATGFDGWAVEIAIPLSLVLDHRGSPARLPFRLFDTSGGVEQDALPSAGPGYFQLPDPAWGSFTP
jgi:hypothetical protein